MVRSAGKKQKGDEAFQTKKQKVGRKKLAPATSTRAEVTARGLRVGVAKSIVEAQHKQHQQTTAAGCIATFTAEEQYSLRPPGTTERGGGGDQRNNNNTIKVPDITTVLVAINHYRAGSRAQALKSAVIWVRHAESASNSPSLTIQLLNSALAALSDTDAPTREAAASVVAAIDQCVLVPSNSWPAVAQSVSDRLNICLTHALIGVRTTAVQLLSDLSSPAKHETKSQLSRTFLAYVASSQAAAVAAASGSTSSAVEVRDDAAVAPSSSTPRASAFEEHDESLRSLLRNTIIVVKTKPNTHFPLLPCILTAALVNLLSSVSSSSSSSVAPDSRQNQDASPSSSTSSSSSSSSSLSSFVSRNHNFVLESLSEVWDFGCIRVKEQFETTVALFRNEPALRMILGILESTSILLSVVAKQIKEDTMNAMTSSSSSSSSQRQLLHEQHPQQLANLLFPRKQLLANLLHTITSTIPFSLDELCSLQTTSPRKSQLATALGEMFLSLLQLQDAAYSLSLVLPSSTSSSSSRQQQNQSQPADYYYSPSSSSSSSAAILNQLMPASAEIKSTIRKSFFKILQFGFELPVSASASASWTTFPDLASFAFCSLNQENFSFLFADENASASAASLLSSLPSWLMMSVTILDNNDKQQKLINNQTEEAIYGLLDLILAVTFWYSCPSPAKSTAKQQQQQPLQKQNISSSSSSSQDIKSTIAQCWEKMVQFHFLLRGNSVNNGSSSSSSPSSSSSSSSSHLNTISPIRQQLIHKSLRLLYQFVSSACRNSGVLKNLFAVSSSNSSSKSSPSSPIWSNIFASMSTIVAMIRQQQQEQQPLDDENSKNTNTNNNKNTSVQEETIHFGSSFLLSSSFSTSSSLFTVSSQTDCNSNNFQQEQQHESRMLTFGVLHFAGICLRFLNQPVPSSWLTLLMSNKLKQEILARFHVSVGSEYLRLLDRILE